MTRTRRAVAGIGLAASVFGAFGLTACSDDDEVTTAEVEQGAVGVPTPDSPALLGVSEAQAFLASPPPGLIVLDVRTPAEFAEGALPNARMIDFESPTFAAEVGEIDRDAPIFVYCRSGNRSAQAVAAMVGLGFTNLTELDGGVVAWQAAGLPLVTG